MRMPGFISIVLGVKLQNMLSIKVPAVLVNLVGYDMLFWGESCVQLESLGIHGSMFFLLFSVN